RRESQRIAYPLGDVGAGHGARAQIAPRHATKRSNRHAAPRLDGTRAPRDTAAALQTAEETPLASRARAASTNRSVLAFAEAMLPGSATIPGATEETVGRVGEVMREFAPQAERAWQLALQTLDAAAVGRT